MAENKKSYSQLRPGNTTGTMFPILGRLREGYVTAEKIWFGTHEGKELSEIPSGYLQWMVDEWDPVPFWKHTRGKSADEVKAMEDRMRNLIRAAAAELVDRMDHDSK